MPKFMIVGSYTNEGAKGFAKEGGAARRAAAAKAAESVGGKLEAMYYAFGEMTSTSCSIFPTPPPPRRFQSPPT